MIFKTFGSKTVKELRRKQGLTAQELAIMIKVSSSIIKKIDHYKIKNVPEPLKGRIEPILRGK
jgi:ribosome-binding protein aMBF1 (putative translation factor)